MIDETGSGRPEVPLPPHIIRGMTSSRSIEEIMRTREPQYESMFAPGQEQLGHYYLPPFQRPSVWTETQAVRLIESVHLGISIGGIVVSDCGNTIRVPNGDGTTREQFPETADWLIDGQQRMRALRRYLSDDLTVFRGKPYEHRWSDLSKRQQRRFNGVSMGYTILEPTSREDLAKLYDLLNFGGTKHVDDQRASDQETN